VKGNGKSRLGFFGRGGAGVFAIALTVLFGLSTTGCNGPGTSGPTVVTDVEITPRSIDVARGETQEFSVLVIGTNNPPQDVIWSVEGNGDAGTAILQNGRLTVSAGEEAETLTVRATSRFNTQISGTATVTVTGEGSTDVIPTHDISFVYEGSGTASAHPARAAQGTTVGISATPDNGYGFTRWEVVSGGISLSNTTTNPATFVMPDGAVTIRAVFTALPPGTPNLSVSRPIFASVTVGYVRPAAQNVTIRNTGTNTATVTGITLGGANPDSFELGNHAAVTSIAAGGSAIITVRPNAGLGAGTYSASIIVNYDDGRTASNTVSFEVENVVTHIVTMAGVGTGGTTTVANQAAGATVTISAGTRADYNFTGWTSTPSVAFADANSADTTFVMPNSTVTVTANWTVIGAATHAVTMVAVGTGGTTTVANQTAGADVTIRAGTRTGYTFTGWTSTPAVTFANASSANTTFEMPDSAVTVTANWTPAGLPGTPGNPIRAVGTTLAEQLEWLHTNAGTGRHYLVEIRPSEIIAPHNLTFSDNRTVNVLLRGTTPGTVTLSGPGSLFTVGYQTSLTLGDNVTLSGLSANNAPLVRVQSGGTLTMDAQTARIIDNTNSTNGWHGGGVRVDEGGMFYMNNGVISGNTANAPGWAGGGGVNVVGTFVMNNGVISDNEVFGDPSGYPSGGGVHVRQGTFTMHSGQIRENTATMGGGGVDIYAGTFDMHGGTVYRNTAYNTGGGVQVVGTGMFTMHSGTISYNNVTNYNGGGVNAIDGGTFTMLAGTISNNTANQGGGVNAGNGTFYMHGGTILGNHARAVGGGGGVRVASGSGNVGVFNMTGGTVYGINANPEVRRNTAGTEVTSALLVGTGSTAQWGMRTPVDWRAPLGSTEFTVSVANGVLTYKGSRAFDITFAPDMTDMVEITGPIISVLGLGHPDSAIITVSNPGQFDSIRWFLGHSEISNWWVVGGDYGETLTLYADFFGYHSIGTHFVTVIVGRDGVQHSKRIAITVRP